LRDAGAEESFCGKARGAQTDRLQLRRALAKLDADDVLLVTSLDRLAATRAAVEAAGADGAILVVGVGTSLELGLMPKNLRVTGIDLSAAMLKIARERVARKALRQVKGLYVMDAGALEFPDAQFDAALAPYVMSVAPNPARVLSEMWRVVRPGGQMIVMNHFAAERGPRALRSKPRWRRRPAGSAGIPGSPMRRSATGSPSALTRSFWSGASWRRCGCSRC
jgi:SAM-dependent methyltransferase